MVIQVNNLSVSFIKHKCKASSVIKQTLKKLMILLIPLPVFMLITGIEGLIKHQSPEKLASIASVGTVFFDFFNMHSLIILGALGLTFIIWFINRNKWS